MVKYHAFNLPNMIFKQFANDILDATEIKEK